MDRFLSEGLLCRRSVRMCSLVVRNKPGGRRGLWSSMFSYCINFCHQPPLDQLVAHQPSLDPAALEDSEVLAFVHAGNKRHRPARSRHDAGCPSAAQRGGPCCGA